MNRLVGAIITITAMIMAHMLWILALEPIARALSPLGLTQDQKAYLGFGFAGAYILWLCIVIFVVVRHPYVRRKLLGQ